MLERSKRCSHKKKGFAEEGKVKARFRYGNLLALNMTGLL